MTTNTRKENCMGNAPVPDIPAMPDIPAARKPVQKSVKVSKSVRELIPMNEFGMMATKDRVVRVDSRMVAEAFEKDHKDVLRIIKNIINDITGFSEDFNRRNFTPITYTDQRGRKQPCAIC